LHDAPPVSATLYFYRTLEHFNKVTYCVPSFVLFALSAIIFFGHRWYVDYDRMSREPWSELRLQEELPFRARILIGIAILLFVIGGIIFPKPL
jgi:hypothetical protein